MRRAILFTLLLVTLATTPSALALRTGGNPVIIPVIGRFPGDGGTLWRTDVVMLNPYSESPTVTLKFYATSGLRQHTVVMNPFSTLVFRDIVLNTYGLEGAGGPLEIVATGTIEARARIYNAGSPAGEFGQGVEGIAKEWLNGGASMYGLSGTAGTRLNVGVTNPNDHDISVVMHILDRNHNLLIQEVFTVGAHNYRQFNNIVALYSLTPQDGLRVVFGSVNDVIYGFASEVRNDTGDAVFTYGTSPNS